MLELSEHVWNRSAQWNLSSQEIAFVVQHGKREHRTGVIFCQMRRDRFPAGLRGNDPCWRLEGTTVVLCACGQFVITAYRNEKAFKKDKRKQKYDLRSAESCCCFEQPA